MVSASQTECDKLKAVNIYFRAMVFLNARKNTAACDAGQKRRSLLSPGNDILRALAEV